MKLGATISSVFLWTWEPFASIRPIVESVLNLDAAIRTYGDPTWAFRSILATIDRNWSLPGVQVWSDEFTSKCDSLGLDFLALAFDGEDPATKLLTPSKNHMLAATSRYLGSEVVVHDVEFSGSLASRCVDTIRKTQWPTSYCLLVQSSGLVARKPHLAYIPSTEVYFQRLCGGRDEVYGGHGDLSSQTFCDVVKGMATIGERAGWKTGTF